MSDRKRRLNCRTCALYGICRSCANECHVGHFIAITDSPDVFSIGSYACQCSAGASCHFINETSCITNGEKSTARRAAETIQQIFLSQNYNKSSAQWLNQATDDRGFISVLKFISFIGERTASEELARETARSPFFRSIHVSTKRAMVSCLHPRAPDVISTFISHLPPLDVTESPLGPLPLDAALFPNVLNSLREFAVLPASNVSSDAPQSLSLHLVTSITKLDSIISTAKELRSFINEYTQSTKLETKNTVSVKCYFIPPSKDNRNSSAYRGIVHFISLSTRTETVLIDVQALICEDDSCIDAQNDLSLRTGPEAIVEYLAPLFLDKTVLKVMFNSGVELMVIQRELGLFFVNVFDVYTAIDELLLDCSEKISDSLPAIPSPRRDKDDVKITTSLLIQRYSKTQQKSSKSLTDLLELATSLSTFSTFVGKFEGAIVTNEDMSPATEWTERPLSLATREKLINDSKSLLRAGDAAWELLKIASSISSSSTIGDTFQLAQMLSWSITSIQGKNSAKCGNVFDRAILRSQLATLRSPPVNAFHGEHGPPLAIPPWYVPCSFCGKVGSHFSVDCENTT